MSILINYLCLPRSIKMASGGKSSPKEPVKLSHFKSIERGIVSVLHKQSNCFLLITSSSTLQLDDVNVKQCGLVA